jgi:pyrroloquinoline quinone biosynthesis protein D
METERQLKLTDTVELNPNFHFRWEEPQQAHVLLYPEGIVKLNDTAAAILEACTGGQTIAAGARELSERYGKGNLDEETLKFLEVAHAKGWIRLKS